MNNLYSEKSDGTNNHAKCQATQTPAPNCIHLAFIYVEKSTMMSGRCTMTLQANHLLSSHPSLYVSLLHSTLQPLKQMALIVGTAVIMTSADSHLAVPNDLWLRQFYSRTVVTITQCGALLISFDRVTQCFTRRPGGMQSLIEYVVKTMRP